MTKYRKNCRRPPGASTKRYGLPREAPLRRRPLIPFGSERRAAMHVPDENDNAVDCSAVTASQQAGGRWKGDHEI